MAPRRHLEALGDLALASRLRRLADRLMADGVRIYQDAGLPFEPRWFGLFHLLCESAPMSIREAAEALGVSHTAISQAVKELRRSRLVSSTRDPSDGRCRRLAPTERGLALRRELEPLWGAFESSARELADESGSDLVAAVGAVERALDRQPLRERVAARSGTAAQ